MPDIFLRSPWPGLAIWSALYISDYVLTLSCASLYRHGVAKKIMFEGSYEITPFHQRDIDSARAVSPRFLAILLIGAVMLALVWRLYVEPLPQLYYFALGAMISVQLAIHVRHFRNLFLFRAAIGTHAVRGHIEYSRPLILRLSSVELMAFSGLFALLFVFTWSWFTMGGAVGCFSIAGKHWMLARRHVASKSS